MRCCEIRIRILNEETSLLVCSTYSVAPFMVMIEPVARATASPFDPVITPAEPTEKCETPDCVADPNSVTVPGRVMVLVTLVPFLPCATETIML